LYAQIKTGKLLEVFNRGPALLRNVLEGLTHEHLLELYAGHRDRHMEQILYIPLLLDKTIEFQLLLERRSY